MAKMAGALKATNMIHGAVKDSVVRDAHGDADTIRLWENYKEQALLWRSLCLLQIPTTLTALIVALVLWHNRSITLNVPRQPLPGSYSAQEIPNEKFIESATELVNLIATYTPANARPQFKKAKEFLVDPLLTQFEDEMMGAEIKMIESTGRIQMFLVDPDPAKLLIVRNGNEVKVQMDGARLKFIGGKELPAVATRYLITMTTIPRNVLNPYGIVISNIQTASIGAKSE